MDVSQDRGDDKQVLSAEEAATLIGVHPNTIRRWAKDGRLREAPQGPDRARQYVRSDVLACKDTHGNHMPEATKAVTKPRVTAPIPAMSSHYLDMVTKMAAVPVPPGILQHIALAERMRIPAASALAVAATMHNTAASVNLPALDMARMSIPSSVYDQMLTVFSGVNSQKVLASLIPPLPAETAAALRRAVFSMHPALVDATNASVALRFTAPEIAKGLRDTLQDQKHLSWVLGSVVRQTPPGLAGLLAQGILPAQDMTRMLAKMVADIQTPRFALMQAHLVARSYQSFCSALFTETATTRRQPRPIDVAAFRAAGTALDTSMRSITALEHYAPPAVEIAPVGPTLYDAIGREVRERDDELAGLDIDDAEAALARSLPIQISATARRIIEARRSCGLQAFRVRQERIFQPTYETEYISGNLSHHVASDEQGFAQFVDWMYKYIFESSDKLKVIKKVTGDDVGEVWMITRLRHYYDHDLEQNSDERMKVVFKAIRRYLHRSLRRGRSTDGGAMAECSVGRPSSGGRVVAACHERPVSWLRRMPGGGYGRGC